MKTNVIREERHEKRVKINSLVVDEIKRLLKNNYSDDEISKLLGVTSYVVKVIRVFNDRSGDEREWL